MITKDLQIDRSEDSVRARVSADALVLIIQKHTSTWPDRFGKDKYRVFIENVVKELDRLISKTADETKEASQNEQ